MSEEWGSLYLCATPIGNLKDITARVIETLEMADLIAAEDTRNSIHLLTHFGIRTPMTSYHEYNKYDKAEYLIGEMRAGKNIALITDAGTPGISDPGEVLVKRCHEEGIRVTSLPGPAACITALTMSGLPTRRFVFEGFLPGAEDKKGRKKVLESIRKEHRTLIFYEAPHHLRAFLADINEYLGNRNIALCRELTKKFEEVKLTTVTDAIAYYEENDPRGEYVLVIEGADEKKLEEEERRRWEEMTPRDHMDYYLDQGVDRKEAMKKVANDRGIQKRELYKLLNGSN
ncbi:16S rRNA (cytidine(1402)-2'-O)-methyltransferase [Butyrivibrio sp. MC2013]|uniref:16S rRNA (cytidine(1402)-2'-O)-methyltransferase n=1 Tax=Butyrivibrio sp. MC2013 TaxID=1280686 RepID=UPI00041A3FBC|nr:16S rRNA (cytidine(1402)-2'-O)-methyltransferase [Butyrivibrio sp. MC2013]